MLNASKWCRTYGTSRVHPLSKVRAVVTVVHLLLNFQEDMSPPPANTKYADIILKYTLRRETRAKLHPCAQQPAPSTKTVERRSWLAQQVSSLFNGAWWGSGITHYCRGCCSSRLDCARKMSCLLVHLIFDPACKRPSENRWGSVSLGGLRFSGFIAPCHFCRPVAL